MFRFRLGAMMLVVLVLGVGFAAIRAGTPLWAAVCVTLALLVLSAATVGAALRRGRPRAAWGGFAFFGWVYLLLSLGPGASEALAPHLLTTHAIEAFLDLAMPEPKLRPYYRVLMRPARETDTVVGSTIVRPVRAAGDSDETAPSRAATAVMRPVVQAFPVAVPASPIVRWLRLSPKSSRPALFRIGHALFTLLIGLVGVVVVRVVRPGATTEAMSAPER